MSKKRNKNNKSKTNDPQNIEIVFEEEENNYSNAENNTEHSGRRTARIGNSNKKENKKSNNIEKKNGKKKLTKKQKLLIALGIIFGIIVILGIVLGVYIFKAGGNVKDAVLNIATDIVGEQDPIFVLVLGVSEDISVELTDTIMLCAYNPSTQKAFMLSIPRDTFVGKSEASASGYDKINALYQKSAEKTVEAVELLTGVSIDYYVIVRNISITSIFECIGSIDFDVPIDMDYDDPTQDLHIHLSKGYQTLEPNQIEQLLRFRHNNDGTSYPSSYGDNDYGRMRTQREFIKAAMNQVISLQNITKLKDIASMVYTNLQTNMSGYTVLDYVPYGLKFDTSNLRSEQLPGQSAMINELWFYKASKSQTRSLVDELMIYLELDDETLDSHYLYASSIKGVKPDDNWVSNEVVIDDDDYTSSSSSKKDTNTTNTVVDKETCEHQYAVYSQTNATCESKGTVVYKCLKCNNETTKTTDALGHKYSNGVCTRCGEKDPSVSSTSTNVTQNNNAVKDETTSSQEHTSHSYTVEVSRTPSTCTQKGSVTKKCTGCDKTTTEELPLASHNYSGATCTVCGTANPNYKEQEKDSSEDSTSGNDSQVTPDVTNSVGQTNAEQQIN